MRMHSKNGKRKQYCCRGQEAPARLLDLCTVAAAGTQPQLVKYSIDK